MTAVRIDRLQAGVIAWLSDAMPSTTVLWAPSEFPRSTAGATFLAARILSGPDLDPQGGASRTPATLPTAMLLSVTGNTAGQDIRLELSGRAFVYTIQGGDSITDARDGLLAEIGSEPMVSATFAASGSDGITITADAIGDLYNTSIAGPATLAATASALAIVSTGLVTTRLEVQAYSTDRTPRGGALGTLSEIRGRARLPSATSILQIYGLALVGSPGRLIDITALSGPRWETRAAWDVRISQVTFAAEAVDPIEIVNATATTDGGAMFPLQVTSP